MCYTLDMKTGISTASLFMRQSTEQAAVTIKELGAECAEVFFSTFYEYRPEFSKKLAPDIAGLEVGSVHVLSTNFEHQLFSSSRRVWGDGFYWLDQVMRSAQLLGCHAYTFHGFNRLGAGRDDLDRIGDRLAEISAFCSRYGVELCLENVSWSTYDRAGMFKELKARCPALKGVLDLKQARRSGYPYSMYIADMAGSISHVHLSDIDERGRMCLPGAGVTDFKEIFSRLKDAGFDGNAVIEVYPDNYGEVEELKKSVEFLRGTAYGIY